MMLPSTPPQRMRAKWEASAQNKHSCYQREASFPFIQVFRMNWYGVILNKASESPYAEVLSMRESAVPKPP